MQLIRGLGRNEVGEPRKRDKECHVPSCASCQNSGMQVKCKAATEAGASINDETPSESDGQLGGVLKHFLNIFFKGPGFLDMLEYFAVLSTDLVFVCEG